MKSRLGDKDAYLFATEQEFAGDKADVGETQINPTHKKPKKRELTEAQKKENRRFFDRRVLNEHVIGNIILH